MAEEEDHREFLLSALRGGVLKAKLFEVELNSVGIALKSGMIDPLQAMKWLKDIGAEWFVGMVPDEMLPPAPTGINNTKDQRNAQVDRINPAQGREAQGQARSGAAKADPAAPVADQNPPRVQESTAKDSGNDQG